MIRGSADLAVLAAHAAQIERWSAESMQLRDVLCLQCTAEMRNSAREAVLPASLHPTIPATMSMQLWQVGDSPWGAFTFAMARVGCRSGVRARGFVRAAYVSTEVAASGLRAAYGFPVQVAAIRMRRHYSGIDASVMLGTQTIFEFSGIDPEPMGHDDVQYTGNLTLAHTPNGLRLVQVEADHHASNVERLTPQLRVFVGSAWGDALLVPSRFVSASIASETIDIPPVRFVCRPDELAFTGTEAV